MNTAIPSADWRDPYTGLTLLEMDERLKNRRDAGLRAAFMGKANKEAQKESPDPYGMIKFRIYFKGGMPGSVYIPVTEEDGSTTKIHADKEMGYFSVSVMSCEMLRQKQIREALDRALQYDTILSWEESLPDGESRVYTMQNGKVEVLVFKKL